MFCKFCGAALKDGSAFCTSCGKRVSPSADAGQPFQQTAQQNVPPSVNDYGGYQNNPVKQSSAGSVGKIVAVAVSAVAVVMIVISGGLLIHHSQQERERELQAVQAERDEARLAAEQAQKDAEAALAEREQAQANAAQAQKDAEQAQQNAEAAQRAAEQAKSDAATQAAIILAAIAAAQDGSTITYDGYIFPSDREYITESDMAYWDQTLTLLARNEIYARHGYVFQTKYIQDYFAAQSWYRPDASYKGAGLSKVEQANVDTILAYEKRMGWL